MNEPIKNSFKDIPIKKPKPIKNRKQRRQEEKQRRLNLKRIKQGEQFLNYTLSETVEDEAKTQIAKLMLFLGQNPKSKANVDVTKEFALEDVEDLLSHFADRVNIKYTELGYGP